jgi:hypothetical protein
MTTMIFQSGCATLLMDRATNGSCHPSCCNRPLASRVGPCRPTHRSGGPSMARWLVPCQARPMTLRAVPFLGRAKFHVPRAGPFAPARNYRTTGGWCLIITYDEVKNNKKKSIVGTQTQQVVCFACRVVPPNGAAAQAWPVDAYGSSGRAVLGPDQLLHATC